MNIEVEIIKGIPEKQIERFEDRVVYYTAMLTREETKTRNAYPYLGGDLSRTEIASPITGSNKKYNLLEGVKYAKHVWKMTNVHWTNSSTEPQWYYNVLRKKSSVITSNAVVRAIKETKK